MYRLVYKCFSTALDFIVTGCPRKVRADYGTENCVVAKLHIAFHLAFEEQSVAMKSFIYGPSTANIVSFILCVCVGGGGGGGGEGIDIETG